MMLPPFEWIAAYEDAHGEGSFFHLYRAVLVASVVGASGLLTAISLI